VYQNDLRVLTIFEAPVVEVFDSDFPFRFPRAVIESGNGSGNETGDRSVPDEPGAGQRSGDDGKPIAVGAAYETAGGGQGGETLIEGYVAHAAQRTQFADR
jgi:hypothetical protein